MLFFCWPEEHQRLSNTSNSVLWEPAEENNTDAAAHKKKKEVTEVLNTSSMAIATAEDNSLESQEHEQYTLFLPGPIMPVVLKESPWDDNSSSASWELILPEEDQPQEADEEETFHLDRLRDTISRTTAHSHPEKDGTNVKLTTSHAFLFLSVVVGVCWTTGILEQHYTSMNDNPPSWWTLRDGVATSSSLLATPTSPSSSFSQRSTTTTRSTSAKKKKQPVMMQTYANDSEKFVWMSLDDDVMVKEFYDPASVVSSKKRSPLWKLDEMASHAANANTNHGSSRVSRSHLSSSALSRRSRAPTRTTTATSDPTMTTTVGTKKADRHIQRSQGLGALTAKLQLVWTRMVVYYQRWNAYVFEQSKVAQRNRRTVLQP